MLIVMNEMAAADNNTNYKGQFERFKTLITDNKTVLERKGIDPESFENFTNYCGCSNNDYSVLIEEGDRRFPMFKCNEIYKGNTDYFDKLIDTCFNQEVGNIFYSYLISPTSFDLVDLNKIPETQIRKEAIEMSEARSKTFSRNFFEDGEATFPVDIIHEIRDDQRPFIFVSDLFDLYKSWFIINYPKGKIRNVEWFSKEIKANCTYLEFTGKKRIPGQNPRSGYFIQPSAYPTTYVEWCSNPMTGETTTQSIQQWWS
jgi:hypothetical protein